MLQTLVGMAGSNFGGATPRYNIKNKDIVGYRLTYSSISNNLCNILKFHINYSSFDKSDTN